jgi:hypothetical protein
VHPESKQQAREHEASLAPTHHRPVGIGGFTYALMLGFMVLSVIYDKEFEPVINFAFDTGRLKRSGSWRVP